MNWQEQPSLSEGHVGEDFESQFERSVRCTVPYCQVACANLPNPQPLLSVIEANYLMKHAQFVQDRLPDACGFCFHIQIMLHPRALQGFGMPDNVRDFNAATVSAPWCKSQVQLLGDLAA